MALPIILGVAAGIAGLAGVSSGVSGAVKMKDANDTMEAAKSKQQRAVSKFESHQKKTTNVMDKVGKNELTILKSFERFQELIGKIQKLPKFKEINSQGVKIPEYKAEELKDAYVGAGVLLGGIGGAAAGTAGGFAAAGATTAAVMALGTASTGTAIASLSGVAATNATLAALGGGAIAAGGGGMALGSAILGGATLGVGLLVGGFIFNETGKKLSKSADEAYRQACKTEKDVNEAVKYFDELRDAADRFNKCLTEVESVYKNHLGMLTNIIEYSRVTDWNDFSEREKQTTQNLILLVGLLYNMCKVKLVLQNEKEGQLNKVNNAEIDNAIKMSTDFMEEKGFAA